MGRTSKVEIPEGSGNFYLYEYVGGQTIYKGPVGDAPPLKEQEFLTAMATLISFENRTMRAQIEKDRDYFLEEARVMRTEQEMQQEMVGGPYTRIWGQEGARNTLIHNVAREMKRVYKLKASQVMSKAPLWQRKMMDASFDHVDWSVFAEEIVDDL